jgi:hypothetical protein
MNTLGNGGQSGSVSQGNSNNHGDDSTEPRIWRALAPIQAGFGNGQR